MTEYSGKFIVVDGPDGCGKSTQSRMLRDWIEAEGTEAVGYRDPGTTDIGEQIREILLSRENTAMETRCELLLYMAARAQLWSEYIEADLKNGRCVVMDRWLSSTCAYQGHAGGFGIDEVIKLAGSSMERLWPDLTIILNVDLKTASGRMKPQPDRMEQKGDAYHKKVREGFLLLAEKRNDIVVIDSASDIDTVHQAVLAAVQKRI